MRWSPGTARSWSRALTSTPRWRAWLTEELTNSWLDGKAFYVWKFRSMPIDAWFRFEAVIGGSVSNGGANCTPRLIR